MSTNEKNTNNVTQALKALSNNGAFRSETDRLRDIFDDVEAALSRNQRDIVLATLHQQGFTMTPTSFKSALQRIRKERKEKQE